MSLNSYVQDNYNMLVSYAEKLTSQPSDLVHFTYLKSIEADFIYINEPMTDYYFKKAMKTNLKDKYWIQETTYTDQEPDDIAEQRDMSKVIQREQIDTIMRHLTWFDRTLFELYLQGQNMHKLSEESGIPSTTVYHRLKKVKAIIKHYYDIRYN